jgi:C-terminal processing protease CtpA/Prc
MTSDQRAAITDKIVALVLEKHVDPSDVNRDYAPWKARVAVQREQLINRADEEFEAGIQDLLAALGTSHMGFTRASNPGMAAIFSLNASLGLVGSNGEQQWMFQQVIEDGPAARSGIRAGEILLEIDGKGVKSQTAPLFALGEPHQLVLENWRTKERRRVKVDLPQASKEKGRPPMVIPKLITSRMLDGKVGYIRGSYFQGVLGQDFIRGFEAAVEALKSAGAKAFVLDFRANPGGGLASLRMMSWLTPARIPVGFS